MYTRSREITPKRMKCSASSTDTHTHHTTHTGRGSGETHIHTHTQRETERECSKPKGTIDIPRLSSFTDNNASELFTKKV